MPVDTGSGSATSEATSGSFAAPGMTAAEIVAAIGRATGLDTTNEATQIYEAITVAGQTACTFEGRWWWFLRGSGSFSTVDGTASYNLRTVNSNAMVDLWAPINLWEDTTRLKLLTYDQYVRASRQLTSGTEGQPNAYALHGDLSAYLYYTPDDEYTIYVDYLKRHSKITAGGGNLIIPAEFRRGIYVDGAVEMLKADDLDGSVLLNSERFQKTIMRMQAAEPEGYDQSWGGNTLGGGGMTTPAGKSLVILDDL